VWAQSRVIDPVAKLAAQQPDTRVDLIVSYHWQPGLVERSAVTLRGGVVGRELPSIDALAINLPAGEAVPLSRELSVAWVTLDAAVAGNSLDLAREIIALPSDNAAPGATLGTGVTVAVIDSGIAPHADFGNRVLERIDFTGHDDPADVWGHGTMMAGLIAGDGVLSEGVYRGVAPGAALVSLRVLDGAGQGRTSDVIAALEWAVEHRSAYAIGVASLALGHPVYESPDRDPLVRAVEHAWDNGIVVVCAAGNRGADGASTIESPANSAQVLAVGALDDRGTPDPADDRVAEFSGQGPTPYEGLAKPDLYAPGLAVAAARGAGYAQCSGTSCSAALVVGAVASSLSDDDVNPAPDPIGVIDQITGNTSPLPGSLAGVLNVELALGGN
jgi:serine protease AprX